MKKIILLVMFLIIAGAGYFGYTTFNPKPMPKPTPSPVSTADSSPSSSPEIMKFSLEQIAEHSTAESCWFAIEGKVYDVTPFVKSGFHPGKDAILQGCGKDATELFNTRPMGSKTPHSERARQNLPKYMIGELAVSN